MFEAFNMFRLELTENYCTIFWNCFGASFCCQR